MFNNKVLIFSRSMNIPSPDLENTGKWVKKPSYRTRRGKSCLNPRRSGSTDSLRNLPTPKNRKFEWENLIGLCNQSKPLWGEGSGWFCHMGAVRLGTHASVKADAEEKRLVIAISKYHNRGSRYACLRMDGPRGAESESLNPTESATKMR